jgi:hypothetical protein
LRCYTEVEASDRKRVDEIVAGWAAQQAVEDAAEAKVGRCRLTL